MLDVSSEHWSRQVLASNKVNVIFHWLTLFLIWRRCSLGTPAREIKYIKRVRTSLFYKTLDDSSFCWWNIRANIEISKLHLKRLKRFTFWKKNCRRESTYLIWEAVKFQITLNSEIKQPAFCLVFTLLFTFILPGAPVPPSHCEMDRLVWDMATHSGSVSALYSFLKGNKEKLQFCFKSCPLNPISNAAKRRGWIRNQSHNCGATNVLWCSLHWDPTFGAKAFFQHLLCHL